MLTASYTNGSAKRSPTLDLEQIVGGHRTRVMSFNVKNRREGRILAQTYAATCWNF